MRRILILILALGCKAPEPIIIERGGSGSAGRATPEVLVTLEPPTPEPRLALEAPPPPEIKLQPPRRIKTYPPKAEAPRRSSSKDYVSVWSSTDRYHLGVGFQFFVKVDNLIPAPSQVSAELERSEAYAIIVEGDPAKDFDIHPSPETRAKQHRAPLGQETTWRFHVTPKRSGALTLLIIVRTYRPGDDTGTEARVLQYPLGVERNARSWWWLTREFVNNGFVSATITTLLGVVAGYWLSNRKRP